MFRYFFRTKAALIESMINLATDLVLSEERVESLEGEVVKLRKLVSSSMERISYVTGIANNRGFELAQQSAQIEEKNGLLEEGVELIKECSAALVDSNSLLGKSAVESASVRAENIRLTALYRDVQEGNKALTAELSRVERERDELKVSKPEAQR
jgi:chromosome segregation ATPase